MSSHPAPVAPPAAAPYYADAGVTLYQGDARQLPLPDASVQTCVTSPPYWGLRDYGMPGQLGLESTPDAYVAAMVDVFREVRRVLADDGTLWLNLGDSYSGNANSGGTNQNDGGPAVRVAGLAPKRGDGLKSKDLCGIPWRVAFALQADGWYLRSDIIWSKPNPMPESVTDRPTKAHEYLFLLAKSARYYYDAAAVMEVGAAREKFGNTGPKQALNLDRQDGGRRNMAVDPNGRNKRSVWHVATQPYPDAHFATYPEKLIEPCILAGSQPGDTVLDPFNGSGTTGVVAIRHQRNYIGCELNPDYIGLSRKRIGAVAPMFATELTA